jgi:ferrochelatase
MPAGRIGILVLQLGTPDAATPAALRRYLREFLLDRRVVDLPRWRWWPILHAFVLTTRPARSAALYERVWTADGSPLAVITKAQAAALRAQLDSGGDDLRVEVAMRYGRPSIDDALDRLVNERCDRIVAVPMYPQYAGATTGSSLERLLARVARRRVVPSVRVVPPYYEDPAYIAALADAIRQDLDGWQPDHLVMSFHGLPRRYADHGDPYPEHCRATADAVARALAWPADRWSLSFQSRFGREPWLEPYTDDVMRGLAARRLSGVAVVCPGFTADCLETLEEIGITGREKYHAMGGGEYRLLACLNTRPTWMQGLATIVSRELEGWRASR